MPSGLLKVSVSEDFLDFFWRKKPQGRNDALDLPSPSTISEETNAELKS